MHPVSPPPALEAAFAAHRAPLLRFVRARGAGDAAEDVLHEVWLRLASTADAGAAARPGYMMRTADRVMIDRFRSTRQARAREQAWAEAQPGVAEGRSADPSADRIVEGRQHAALVEEALRELGPRAVAIFRRHRVDGIPQREVAREFAVSLSTVESDLRLAYRALVDVRRRIDEG